MERRELIGAACVCVGLFALFFAIGRFSSSGAAPREQTAASVQPGSASTVVPVSLGSSPPIALAAAVASSAPARSEGAPRAVNGAVTIAQTSSQTRAVVTPVSTAAPARIPAASSPPAPAAAVETAPPVDKGGSGSARQRSATQHSTGTSFESSG